MTTVQVEALKQIKAGKSFNGKLYGEFVYVGGEKYQVSGKQGKATISEFLAAANAVKSKKQEETFDSGFGYYGTAKDAARGFDGIE